MIEREKPLLPSLPHRPASLPRRWSLAPPFTAPVTTLNGGSTLLVRGASNRKPTQHAPKLPTAPRRAAASLPLYVMAQQSPISEQGPPVL